MDIVGLIRGFTVFPFLYFERDPGELGRGSQGVCVVCSAVAWSAELYRVGLVAGGKRAENE